MSEEDYSFYAKHMCASLHGQADSVNSLESYIFKEHLPEFRDSLVIQTVPVLLESVAEVCCMLIYQLLKVQKD